MNIVLYVGISSYISTTRAIQYPGGPVLSEYKSSTLNRAPEATGYLNFA